MNKNVNMIEIMGIVNLPAVCLNRDEANQPKEMNFGGFDRGRVSSQAQKFAIRNSELFRPIEEKISKSIRTANVANLIIPRLENVPEGFDDAIVALCDTLNKKGEAGVPWDKETDTYDFSKVDYSKNKLSTGKRTQIIQVFSNNQIDFLVETIQRFVNESDGDVKKFMAFKNKNVFERRVGNSLKEVTIDTALFGSMTASEFSDSVPASMHVAQMFSTDALVRENDFYIASDDAASNSGAANMGDMGYNCSCMYKYASIDLDILRSNLNSVENKDEVIKEIVPELVKAFALTLPKGKQNTNAGYTLPDMICVNLKEKKVPCNYANAFVTPVKATMTESVTKQSIDKFIGEVDKIDRFYGLEVVDRLFMNCLDNGAAPKNATVVDNLNILAEAIKESL